MQTNHVASVLEDLVETLEDGRKGFEQTAEKLASDGHTDIAATMRQFAEQRARFSVELQQIAGRNGVDLQESGSVSGALHRGWIGLKDALTGSDPHAVLAAAETGEDHAVSEYEDALSDMELPADVRDVIVRQSMEVRTAHDTVRGLRDATG